jgi:flagellar biosynthesis protein FliQ
LAEKIANVWPQGWLELTPPQFVAVLFFKSYIVNTDVALHMVTDLFWTGLWVCLPVLGLTMVVGLLISILQVVTQVQEMTLTFVPKLITAALSIVVFGPWMLHKLVQFTSGLWTKIPALAL